MCPILGHILIQTVLLQFQIKRAPADTQQLGSGFPVIARCFQCFQNSCPFRPFIVQRIEGMQKSDDTKKSVKTAIFTDYARIEK